MSAPVRLFTGLLYLNCLVFVLIIGDTKNYENTSMDVLNNSDFTTPQHNSTDSTDVIFNTTDFSNTNANTIARVVAKSTYRVITAETPVYWRSWLVGLMGLVLLLMIIIVCIVIVVQTEDSQRSRVRPSIIVLKGANLARDSSPCPTPRQLRKINSNWKLTSELVDESTQVSVTPSSSSDKQNNESDSCDSQEEDSSTSAKE